MDRIQQFGKDAQGKDCPEGYYAVEERRAGVLLMPPTAEMAPGLRLATAEEVDRGPIIAAETRHCRNAVANPSDAKAASDVAGE